MTQLSAAELETIRKRPQQTKLYLSIYEPQIIFQARINDGSIDRGARTITYDSVSLGAFTAIKAGATMWVGTTPGGNDIGKIRVRSATSSEIIVSENSNIEWADNLYLTVFFYFELWPVFPRIIQDPSNPEETLWYKDYDIPYTNQNSILGTFINIGPNRAANVDPATGLASLYWSSSGTHNVVGATLSYDWWFQGATVTGSSAADPGFRTYAQAGNYITRLTISGSNGGIDTTYRTVRIHDPNDPPVQKWQLLSLNGARDQGGYTASFKVFEEIPIQEHAVVVIYMENWYGDTKQNLGGNYPNASGIFWVGYVDQDSINYDYEHSEMTFSANSITEMMRQSSGFSVSVESKANPTDWYELLDMDSRRAIYHYLRWHTTALNIADFRFLGDDFKIQFFDADRESMYDALDNYMRDTLWGKVVSDRQGKVWLETEAEAYPTPTASFPPIMDITRRDWMGEPSIEERLSEEVSFLEMNGVAYSGVVTGTFSALIGAAPGNAPGFHGNIEIHSGMALLGQTRLNQMVGNVFANKNSPFPSVEMNMVGNYANLDIAPQETVQMTILAADTVRNLTISSPYLPNNFDWMYNGQDSLLLPNITFKQLVDGVTGETIIVSPPEEVENGFDVPGFSIPPIPPFTVPAYSIPTGTLGVIIDESITNYLADYRNFYFNGASSVGQGRGVVFNGAIGVSATTGAATVTFSAVKTGVYLVQGYATARINATFQVVTMTLGANGSTVANGQAGADAANEEIGLTLNAIVTVSGGGQMSLGWAGSGGLGWSLISLGFSVIRISA